MRYLFLLLFLLTSSCQAAFSIRSFPLDKHIFKFSYPGRAETCAQARKRTKADYVFGGPYFEPRTYRLIDYFVHSNRVINDQRWDWHRPVFWIKNQHVEIWRPTKKEIQFPFKTLQPDWAIAVDNKTTHRFEPIGRQILALKNNILYCVRLYGTEQYARKFLKQWGLQEYVFLDGGSSTPVTARIPVHLLVFNSKSTKLIKPSQTYGPGHLVPENRSPESHKRPLE